MVDINQLKNNVIELSKKLDSFNIDSIFVEENEQIQKIIYKEYPLHELRSCSKLITALAVGILIEKEMILLEEEIYPVIKDLVTIKRKSNIKKIEKWTVRDLLLHQTGYEGQMMSERYIENIDKENLLEYALNYDIPYEVGTRYAYNNVEPFIFSAFLKEKLNINLSDFVYENIFLPMNILEFKWDNYGKYCPGATGLFLSHENFHKIGQLLLNDGKYQEKQIVPKTWIEEMCKMQLETPSMYKEERVLPKVGVGYYTFISRDGYIFRDGAAGQYIILNKEKNLLITIMSTEKDMKNITEILRGIV